MISTYQALAVAIIAILPGATYSFAYERHAGAYGAHLGDRLVRFLVASGAFHALFGGLEFVIARRLEHSGFDALRWWQVEVIVVVYFTIPFVAGSVLGVSIHTHPDTARRPTYIYPGSLSSTLRRGRSLLTRTVYPTHTSR